MATEITTKVRLERLMAAKAKLEAQISQNGQILAAVNNLDMVTLIKVPLQRCI